MSVARRGWRSRDPRLDPARRVHVEHMRIAKIGEARFLALIVVATEDDEGGASQSR